MKLCALAIALSLTGCALPNRNLLPDWSSHPARHEPLMLGHPDIVTADELETPSLSP